MLDSMLALLKPNQAESRVFTLFGKSDALRAAIYCVTFCTLASLVC